eukprot:c47635_g1_i1 orf=206-541(-)
MRCLYNNLHPNNKMHMIKPLPPWVDCWLSSLPPHSAIQLLLADSLPPRFLLAESTAKAFLLHSVAILVTLLPPSPLGCHQSPTTLPYAKSCLACEACLGLLLPNSPPLFVC